MHFIFSLKDHHHPYYIFLSPSNSPLRSLPPVILINPSPLVANNQFLLLSFVKFYNKWWILLIQIILILNWCDKYNEYTHCIFNSRKEKPTNFNNTITFNCKKKVIYCRDRVRSMVYIQQ